MSGSSLGNEKNWWQRSHAILEKRYQIKSPVATGLAA
jgi:hypothetical protein